MKIPRLTEVFVLREANVTTLAQMNKLPLYVADYINKKDRQNAPEIAKLYGIKNRSYMDQLIRDAESEAPKPGEDVNAFPFSGLIDSFLTSREWEITKKAIKDNPSQKKQIIDKVASFFKQHQNAPDGGTVAGETEIGNKFLAMMEPYRSPMPSAEELKKRAVLKFPDGYFWVKLEKGECDWEGQQMQHCGTAAGDMYSLRDPQGKPHVTLDYEKKFNTIPQLRGKQNSAPDKKYKSHVDAMVKKLGDPEITDSTSDEGELPRAAQRMWA